MTGLTKKAATEWRRESRETLEEAGLTVLDPTRGLTFLESNEVIQECYDFEGSTENAHTVFEIDKFDATRAGILLVNLLTAPKISIGTVIEMAWAHLSGTFVVTVMEDVGNPHDHPFIRKLSSVIFHSPEDACSYIVEKFGR